MKITLVIIIIIIIQRRWRIRSELLNTIQLLPPALTYALSWSAQLALQLLPQPFLYLIPFLYTCSNNFIFFGSEEASLHDPIFTLLPLRYTVHIQSIQLLGDSGPIDGRLGPSPFDMLWN